MAFGQQSAEGFRNAETIIANSVILVGPHESLLAYFPSVGFGNLVASISSATFLDGAGNQVLDGVYEYYNLAGTYVATGLDQGTLGFVIKTAASAAGPYTIQGYMAYSSPGTITMGGISSTLIPSLLTAMAGLNVTGGIVATGNISGVAIGGSGSGTFGGIGQFGGLLTCLAGLAVSGGAITAGDGIVINDIATPASVGAAAVEFATSGFHKFIAGVDGNVYNTGRLTAYAAGQTINSAAFTPVTGLSVFIGNGLKYRFRLLIEMVANAGGQWQIELLGPAVTALNYGFKYTSGAGVTALNANETAFSTALAGPAASVGGAYWIEIEGTVTPSANGNMSISALATVPADTWAIETASYLELYPVA